MDDGDTRKLLFRALHETLEVYVTPAVRLQLLRDALTMSGLSRPPSCPEEADQFLRDGLLEAAAKLLGYDVAESIIHEISQIVGATTRRSASRSSAPTPASYRRPTPRESHRRSSRPGVTTAPPQRRSLSPLSAHGPKSDIRFNERATTTGPAVTPGEYFRKVAGDAHSAIHLDRGAPVRVLVASTDQTLLAALTNALGENGEVFSLRSVFSVVQAVQERDQGRLFILLDGESPGVRPAALAALAEDLTDVTVVLCRASLDVEHELALISPHTRSWVRLHGYDSARAVAEDCAALVS